MQIRTTIIRSVFWILILLAVFAIAGLVYELVGLLQSMPIRGLDSSMLRLIGFMAANLLLTAVLACVGVIYLWGRFSSRLPDLQGWHLQRPSSEFKAAAADASFNLDRYLQKEDQVYRELDELCQGPWARDRPTGAYNRFHPNSVCNPRKLLDRNWNRSLVQRATNPKGGVLLLHGLSDSPYSLRAIGERMHREGYTVIWLRVPGHGTCPNALANVSWKDWTAAVKIAAQGLAEMLPPKVPLILAGYSNGGALSLQYALSTLEDESLPRVDSLVLFSPMIGINPMASITWLYHVVGLASGNKKSQWSNVSAEIDPYKYTSWPMNGSVQAWEMTQAIEQKLAALEKAHRMDELPPVLAFQSVVDSTVETSKLINVLFNRLVSKANQLFLFDINRVDRLSDLLNRSFEKSVFPNLKNADVSFQLSVLQNSGTESQRVEVQTREDASWNIEELQLHWPSGIASLSHVAVPFPPEDPVYGTREAHLSGLLPLGSLSLLTEPSLLMIPNSLFTRCRHNPFYSFMEDRIVRWLENNKAEPLIKPKPLRT
ncbi:MAG: alpha/beta fold hydrolase [Planctomycetota bacterium]|nr:alpha/beta fold hydrolase [Planctomycetota bacterium]